MFSYKKISLLTLSGLRRECFSLMMLPATLKTLSLGTLVAGMHKTKDDKCMYCVVHISHQVSGFLQVRCKGASVKYLSTSEEATSGGSDGLVLLLFPMMSSKKCSNFLFFAGCTLTSGSPAGDSDGFSEAWLTL